MPPSLSVADNSATVDAADAGALIRLLNVVLRRRRTLLLCGLAGAAIPALLFVMRPRTFTSSGAFVPQTSGSGRSQLSGLAAQFGLSAGLGAGADAPGYYPDLIHSRGILRIVGGTSVTLPYAGHSRTAPLWWWLHPTGKSVPQKVESATDILASHTQVLPDKQSGIIRFGVTYSDSVLPAVIARRILSVLNDFNLHTKQSQASAERSFVEARLAEAREELRRAENALQVFLQTNREYRNSPQLFFQQDRLQRDVTTRQGVVTSLTQAYEQARIDEVRNTPVFTVLEEPQIPVRPDPRGILIKAVVGFLIGTLLGLAIVIGAEYLRRVRTLDPAAYAELSDNLHLVGGHLRRSRRVPESNASGGDS